MSEAEIINDLLKRIDDLQSDALLYQQLVSHLVAIIIRREAEPKNALETLRKSSERNLKQNIVWTSGEAEGNERLRAKTLIKHEQFFEELKRALGQREGEAH